MEHIEKKVTAHLSITDILNGYIQLGSVKTIKKLSQPNSYKITIRGTETLAKVIEIKRHLQKYGYQTRVFTFHKYRNALHYENLATKKSVHDTYIIAKVAAPPKPKNPDDFGKLKPSKTSQKKKRG